MRVVSERWFRVAVGVAVLAAVVWTTGTGPFLHGVRSLDLLTLALGAAIAVPTTVACAWRWRLVARGLGVGIDLPGAVAACYRAQLLNATLPGGVLGDVHRGVRHGVASEAVGRGLRSVMWERVAGQVVQLALVIVVLTVLPSPFRGAVPVLVGVLVGGALVVALVLRRRRPGRRLLGVLTDDVRAGLLARQAWPGVVVASTLAVAGHLATYVVAARAVGVDTPLLTLLPLALVVLLAAGLPLNVAGWGPREGMAAGAFAAAGLGAGQGVATAVAYGVVVVVATLPGAVVLLAGARRRTPRAANAPSAPGAPSAPSTPGVPNVVEGVVTRG